MSEILAKRFSAT